MAGQWLSAAAAMAEAACATPDAATRQFVFNQTMLRVRDPRKSVDFYTRVLGMTLLQTLDFPEMKFSLFFVGYPPAGVTPPADAAERRRWVSTIPATLELTYNYGTDTDPSFAGYHSGNVEPRGFGHIGISVPDVYEACARFEALGVKFRKRPDEGRMKGLAFLEDPDGYWVEILKQGNDL